MVYGSDNQVYKVCKFSFKPWCAVALCASRYSGVNPSPVQILPLGDFHSLQPCASVSLPGPCNYPWILVSVPWYMFLCLLHPRANVCLMNDSPVDGDPGSVLLLCSSTLSKLFSWPAIYFPCGSTQSFFHFTLIHPMSFGVLPALGPVNP